MSKFVAERSYRMTDENGDLVISYVVHGIDKQAARAAFDETKKTEGKLEVDVKPYKSRRSLEQNKLLWVLLGKMAAAMSGKKIRYQAKSVTALCLKRQMSLTIICWHFPKPSLC